MNFDQLQQLFPELAGLLAAVGALIAAWRNRKAIATRFGWGAKEPEKGGDPADRAAAHTHYFALLEFSRANLTPAAVSALVAWNEQFANPPEKKTDVVAVQNRPEPVQKI